MILVSIVDKSYGSSTFNIKFPQVLFHSKMTFRKK